MLTPGFGGSARQPLLVRLAGALKTQGIRARRLSFKPGRPSEGLLEEQRAVQRAVAGLRRASAEAPVVLIGRSFGGRVCARLALRDPPAALVLLGFPLAPKGKLRAEDDAALRSVQCPTLVVQGDADELGPLPLVESAVKGNPRLSLHVLANTGHGFDTRAREAEAIAQTVRWLRSVLDPGDPLDLLCRR